MAKTGKQVQDDFYQFLRSSSLSAMISGTVYKEGYRPRDSKKEDAVVIFTGGFAREIQTGVVTINIYVPDIDPYENGVLTEDGERTAELERAAQLWVNSLSPASSCYKVNLMNTIHTIPESTINQHIVVVSLQYEFYGNDEDN